MSLVGNLEELALGEILQIIGLSRKSGTLSLRSAGREAVIVFNQGQVVRASSSLFPQSLGELLTKHAVIDPIVLRKALARQQSEGFLERLGTILVKHFNVNADVIEEVVRHQVENVVISLFEWTHGTFDFKVQDLVEAVYDTKMDPLQFMLSQGLNPQLLAMEGSEEGRLREPEQQQPVATAGHPSPHPCLVVDDDPPTLRALSSALEENGYQVYPFERCDETLATVEALLRSGSPPLVLVDLIMPRMDGAGVLGGLELMEQLQGKFGDLPLLLMSDYRFDEAEARAGERGCSLVMKPRRADIGRPELLEDFMQRLLVELRRLSGGATALREREKVNLGEELRLEMDDNSLSVPSAEEAEGNGVDQLLEGMLEELKSADTSGGVPLLLLRFASEFMNRAVVFAVHDRVVSGVGQFGISDGTISGDERVRAINVPLEAGSLFSGPAQTGRADTFPPAMTPLDAHIFHQLGGGVPQEVFVGPIMGASGLIGFLYGDNLPDGGALAGTEILGLFLSRAGSAMEEGLRPSQGRP